MPYFCSCFISRNIKEVGGLQENVFHQNQFGFKRHSPALSVFEVLTFTMNCLNVKIENFQLVFVSFVKIMRFHLKNLLRFMYESKGKA